MRGRGWLAILLVTAAFTGCLGTEDAAISPASQGPDRPEVPQSPLDRLPVDVELIEMRDGVEIEIAIWRPDVPEGTLVPAVLHAQPYAGSCYLAPTPMTCVPSLDNPGHVDFAYGGMPSELIERGYAWVEISVRGTGNSGGCLSANGPAEAADIGEVIDVLANASWSNGRVAMHGLSYMGTTPWLGALQGKDALRAIVPGGIVTDEYTFTFTPQGAGHADAIGFNVPYFAGLTLYPPLSSDPQATVPDWGDRLPERLCPGLLDLITTYPVGMVTDTRSETFFQERSNIGSLDTVEAAILLTQGFQESSPGHGYQEDVVWEATPDANTSMILGQWGHQFPSGALLDGLAWNLSWTELLSGFLDHHLRDGPAPAWMGQVAYQATDGSWATSSSWPPASTRQEVLHVAPDQLTREPADAPTRLGGKGDETSPSCTALETAELPISPARLHVSDPVEEPVLLAGNPMAHLLVESDQPGGLVAVDLYDLGPDFRCDTDGSQGARWLSSGAADLRFHTSPFEGQDFPTGEPTPVRVDLLNLAHRLEPGHRLALATSTWGKQQYKAPGYTPTLTLHPGDVGSHLVLPVVEGSLGGSSPMLDYPERPFGPAGPDPST